MDATEYIEALERDCCLLADAAEEASLTAEVPPSGLAGQGIWSGTRSTSATGQARMSANRTHRTPLGAPPAHSRPPHIRYESPGRRHDRGTASAAFPRFTEVITRAAWRAAERQRCAQAVR